MDVMTESIYNLIPKPVHDVVKTKLYRSRYDPNAPLTGSSFGLHGTTATVGKGVSELKKNFVINSTFGPPPSKNSADPSQFLRKGSRTFKSKSSTPFRRRPLTLKPPVPSSHERPVMGLVTCKNFISSNAADVIIMCPSSPKVTSVNYLQKQDYGRVPDYLAKVNRAIAREKVLIDNILETTNRCEPGKKDVEFEEMDEQERHNIIELLKAKWDLVNSKYQKVCHRVTIDSLGDIRRKESQERELRQLELDIEKLSRSGPLLIPRNCNSKNGAI